MSLLEVRGLRKAFGAVTAVSNATLSVANGEIAGLIGPNGAGKTTTFDLIAGNGSPDAGEVFFDSRNLTGRPAYRVAQAGLVRTFQTPRTFNHMSVWENMLFAGALHPGESFWAGVLSLPTSRRREKQIVAQAGDVLEFLEITHVADLPAGSLSGGQRKLLELARVLMRDPTMLLLDEPFAGVAPELTAKIVEKLRALREAGRTILLIEHDLDTVMSLVDRLIVMHLGAVLTSGEPVDVRRDQRVLEAYLGGSHA